MARQARAVRTRRSIVEAAACVFADRGYERAAISEILHRANVTKGALYFHFAAKSDLARAVIDEQTALVTVPEHGSPLQSVVDITHQFAYALRHDPLARAGSRLSIEGVLVDGTHPWGGWFELTARLLAEGKAAGEVLPQVDPVETAEFVVASFTGVQLVAQALTGRADLRDRVAVLWRHLLPSVAHPGALARVRPEGVTDPATTALGRAHRPLRTGASGTPGA
ncbi:ScbR family autoregulator-binding transcription factor [Streptomyces sp. 142MFCol3.1]|uniref:ScbR family autoregulator-binding transcription factor n=1 Tax=Streptomyces sp. 142MFCol3.1 TaxID=1172179 RepID=UPI0006884C12